MKFRDMKRTYRALLRGLDVPAPLDMRLLCDRVAQRTKRPIHLEAISLPPKGPCGLWVATGKRDYIFYTRDTSPLHQEHIIAHELGHILCDHRSASLPAAAVQEFAAATRAVRAPARSASGAYGAASAGAYDGEFTGGSAGTPAARSHGESGGALAEASTSAVAGGSRGPGAVLPAAVFEHLDPATVDRVLRRAHDDTPEEREAELMASLMLQKSHRGTIDPAVSADQSCPVRFSRFDSSQRDAMERVDRSLRHVPKDPV